jgi:hypothetical protein
MAKWSASAQGQATHTEKTSVNFNFCGGCNYNFYVPLAYVHTALPRFMQIFQKYLFTGQFRVQEDSTYVVNYP